MFVIEKDNELASDLENKFNNQITIINEDVLKIDETKLFKEEVTVFGNLPYNVSTEILSKWIINLKKNFYPPIFNAGIDHEKFDENKLIENIKNIKIFNFQGSTKCPGLVHKDIWNKVGGLSEEYFPGTGSDPDFNMKLWNLGIRFFKGINNFKVYHFGSIVLRKKINRISKKNYGSVGAKIFLLKWGITIKFFKKFYLKSNTKYLNPLNDPNKKFTPSFFT